MANNADVTFHNSLIVINFFEESIVNDSNFMFEASNVAAAKNLVKEKKKSENITKSISEHLYFIKNGEFKDSPLAPQASDSRASDQRGDNTDSSVVDVNVDIRTSNSPQASIDTFIEGIKSSVAKKAADVESTKQAFIKAYVPPEDELARRKDLPKAWDLIGEALKKDLSGKEYKSLRDRLVNGLIEECVPCEFRIDALADIDIFGDFLNALEADIEARLQQLKDLFDILFKPPDALNLCRLINFFSFMCVPDLYAMIGFLLGYYNSYLIRAMGFPGDAMAALMGLISVILSPMLLFLDGLFDELLALVLTPVNCVVDALASIVEKFPVITTGSHGTVNASRASFKREHIKTEIRDVFNPVKMARKAGTDFSKIQTIEDNSQNISPSSGTHSPTNMGRVSGNMAAINKSISSASPISSTIRNTLDVTERALASILVARNWVNDYILKTKKKLFALLKQDVDSTANVYNAVALGMDIYMLTSLIKTIIDLINEEGLRCDGSHGDTAAFLDRMSNGGTGNYFDIIDVGSFFLPGDEPGEKTNGVLGLAPSGFSNNIIIDDGALYVEEDVPGLGQVRLPVSIIKSCKGKLELENNPELKQWMEDVLSSVSN